MRRMDIGLVSVRGCRVGVALVMVVTVLLTCGRRFMIILRVRCDDAREVDVAVDDAEHKTRRCKHCHNDHADW